MIHFLLIPLCKRSFLFCPCCFYINFCIGIRRKFFICHSEEPTDRSCSNQTASPSKRDVGRAASRSHDFKLFDLQYPRIFSCQRNRITNPIRSTFQKIYICKTLSSFFRHSSFTYRQLIHGLRNRHHMKNLLIIIYIKQHVLTKTALCFSYI